MSIDPAASPTRRRAFRIRTMMAAVVVIALALGWFAWIDRSFARIAGDQARINAWVDRLQADNPTLAESKSITRIDGGFFGNETTVEVEYRTPTGRPISIEAHSSSRPFGPARAVVIASGDRTLTWPIADIERGRPIDLKAEFPEAFR